MRTLAIYAVTALIAATGIFGAGYFAGWESMVAQYTDLASSVKVSNRLATEKLAALTKDRDKKQAELDRLAVEQERQDEEAQNEINRLAGELDSRPVRVRIVPEAGECGSSSEGGDTEGSENRERNSGPTYGILPEENSRRLGEALTEIETLSAAYASCRSRLFSVGSRL